MIQLRYVGIPYLGSQIPGICISLESEGEAYSIAETVRDYYETPGEKPIIEVAFRKRKDLYDFQFFLGSKGSVDIFGVDKSIPENVLSGLGEFGGFVILLGFNNANGSFEMFDTKKFHMVKRGLTIDGGFVMGHERVKVNWVELFR